MSDKPLSPLFSLHNATLSHDGLVVLNHISLTIYKGEKVALLGESGSGKSTLLANFYQQQRQACSWVPQAASLVQALSVYHNIYSGRLDQYPTWRNIVNLLRPFKSDVDEITLLLAELNLQDKLFHKAQTLSGGQQQRTAVARALYQQRESVLADEPVSAVDVKQAQRILEYINRQSQTVVVALHDAVLAHHCMDRIIGLREGKIYLDVSTQDIECTELLSLYDA